MNTLLGSLSGSMNCSANHHLKQVAIDGPSASGKSTVGARLADLWGYDFLDTGMMYRAVTYSALKASLPLGDAKELGRLATETEFSVHRMHDGSWQLMMDHKDVTHALYTSEINVHVSPVSAVSEVRRALVKQQREIADRGPIVMVGRDIGTVVLPNAAVKVYLDASPSTRAARRARDVNGNIDGQCYEEVLQSIKRRDDLDTSREDSPLRPADDALIVSTDQLNPDEVVARIVELTSSRSGATIDNQAQ